MDGRNPKVGPSLFRASTMPFHVRITQKSDRSHDEVKLDLTREELEERFLAPYRQGRPITMGGKSLFSSDIERMRITSTDEASAYLIPIVQSERQRSRIAVFGITDEWEVADRGKDVTDDFIRGPPGVEQTERRSPRSLGRERAKTVFVVYGRNSKLKESMFSFLHSIGLQPLDWSSAVAETGRGTPYIGEVLNAAFSIAQAVVVLMTPDDEGRLRDVLSEAGDPAHETNLTPQARLNVIFEAGMAMGRSPDRTIIVEIGHLRPFSDLSGLHVVRLDDSTQRRQEFARRLQTAGCPTDLSDTQWHSAGSFEIEKTQT